MKWQLASLGRKGVLSFVKSVTLFRWRVFSRHLSLSNLTNLVIFLHEVILLDQLAHNGDSGESMTTNSKIQLNKFPLKKARITVKNHKSLIKNNKCPEKLKHQMMKKHTTHHLGSPYAMADAGSLPCGPNGDHIRQDSDFTLFPLGVCRAPEGFVILRNTFQAPENPWVASTKF